MAGLGQIFNFYILFLITVTIAAKYKHIILMHGLLSKPGHFEKLLGFINESHPGTTYSLIDSYDDISSLAPMWKQVNNIGNKMQEIMKQHPEGVHLLCFSQGGLVCRGVLESLEKHNVINFISLSSPQGGQFGDTSYLSGFFPNLVKENAWRFFYSFLGQLTSVGNYWNDPHRQKEYKEYSKFLAVINNQSYNPHASEYRSNFLRLKNLVLIGGPDDGVITPWQSSMFAAYNDKEQVVNMRQQEWYTEDWFGLKTLDKRKAIQLCEFSGVAHVQWTERQDAFKTCILPYLT